MQEYEEHQHINSNHKNQTWLRMSEWFHMIAKSKMCEFRSLACFGWPCPPMADFLSVFKCDSALELLRLDPAPPPQNRWGRRSSCCCAENVVCYPVSLWGSCIEILCPRLSAPLNSRNTGTQCLEANSGVVIVRCKWCVVNHIQVEGLVCVCVCQRGLQSDWHHLPVNAVAL